MAKRKTILSPTEQWNRTAEIKPIWGTGREFAVENGTADFHGRCLDLYGEEQGQLMSPVIIGRIKVNTRAFMAGDLVLVFINNGGAERFPVAGVSSRGYLVNYSYMRVRRWNTSGGAGEDKRESGPLELLEPPDELVGLRLAHPAVRAWVKTMGTEARP